MKIENIKCGSFLWNYSFYMKQKSIIKLKRKNDWHGNLLMCCMLELLCLFCQTYLLQHIPKMNKQNQPLQNNYKLTSSQYRLGSLVFFFF